MYDVSGSAHFINKCDNGIVIHRNRNPEAGPVDQVQVGFTYKVLFYQVYYLFSIYLILETRGKGAWAFIKDQEWKLILKNS